MIVEILGDPPAVAFHSSNLAFNGSGRPVVGERPQSWQGLVGQCKHDGHDDVTFFENVKTKTPSTTRMCSLYLDKKLAF